MHIEHLIFLHTFLGDGGEMLNKTGQVTLLFYAPNNGLISESKNFWNKDFIEKNRLGK